METGYYIFGGAILAIGGYSVYKKIKFKHKNGQLNTLVYDVTEIFYLKGTYKALILKSMNSARAVKGYKPLIVDDLTSKLAQGRCVEMDFANEYTHELVKDEFILLDSLGVDGSGENIAYGYGTMEGLMNAWFASEGHYDNLMNPKWDWCGIGIVKDEKNRYIYCVLFGNENTL